MKYNQGKYHRRSIRLKGYDYASPGAYFITICTQNRECMFGEIFGEQMVLNEWGKIVKQCWLEIPMHFANTVLDEYVIMPNHVHGIIIVGAQHAVPLRDMCKNTPTIEQFGKPTHRSIPTIIRSYKSAVTRYINQKQNISGVTLWQCNYYEHIIRNKEELNQIREYIVNNPLKWELDENNPIL